MHGNNFTISYSDVVIKEHVPALPKTARLQIQKAIEQKLTTNPIQFGKPMQHSFRGHRRLRVADYRVIYRVDPTIMTVFVTAIGHRKYIYEG
jgi:mRNA-degrading endonuclease RelE of RelBE toxin-antitoxin system